MLLEKEVQVTSKTTFDPFKRFLDVCLGVIDFEGLSYDHLLKVQSNYSLTSNHVCL